MFTNITERVRGQNCYDTHAYVRAETTYFIFKKKKKVRVFVNKISEVGWTVNPSIVFLLE